MPVKNGRSTTIRNYYGHCFEGKGPLNSLFIPESPDTKVFGVLVEMDYFSVGLTCYCNKFSNFKS